MYCNSKGCKKTPLKNGKSGNKANDKMALFLDTDTQSGKSKSRGSSGSSTTGTRKRAEVEVGFSGNDVAGTNSYSNLMHFGMFGFGILLGSAFVKFSTKKDDVHKALLTEEI